MVKDTYKDIQFKVKRETGRYKPAVSINLGFVFPVSIDGYNIQYLSNKFLVDCSIGEAVVLAKKMIDKISV